MLKRVLKQMQFNVEHTGGGCEAMTLYTHGHAIVVTLDASIEFDEVSPDQPIHIGIYRGMSPYHWGDDNHVQGTDCHTQSLAIGAVIDALDFTEQREKDAENALNEASYGLWCLIAERIGRPQTCANEIELSELRYQDQCLVKGFRQIWEGLD